MGHNKEITFGVSPQPVRLRRLISYLLFRVVFPNDHPADLYIPRSTSATVSEQRILFASLSVTLLLENLDLACSACWIGYVKIPLWQQIRS